VGERGRGKGEGGGRYRGERERGRGRRGAAAGSTFLTLPPGVEAFEVFEAASVAFDATSVVFCVSTDTGVRASPSSSLAIRARFRDSTSFFL
jgi:hypothetical protein